MRKNQGGSGWGIKNTHDQVRQEQAKNKKKKRIADLSKHRYFREPWALTFAGGADFEERRPRVKGKVPEFLRSQSHCCLTRGASPRPVYSLLWRA